MWKDYVLDVTFSVPAFCPYESNPERVFTGVTHLSERCPGNLVGVYHSDGLEAADDWCKRNPGWRERFARLEGQE